MELVKKHYGTTASQVIVKADSDLEAEGIELCLKYGFRIKGGYIKNRKNGQTEFVFYPRAARKELSELDLKKLNETVTNYVDGPTLDLGQGIETQVW
jgi:hypothetical protein